MKKLSEHFSLEELTSTDVHGIDNSPYPEIVKILLDTAQRMESVRTLLLSYPVHVNSGYRSPGVNIAVNGSPNSAHMSGHAVDFICPAYGTPLEICQIIAAANLKFDQLIQEGTWVHISFDPRFRQEVLTKSAHGYKVGL